MERRIDPTAARDNDRVEIGPTALAFAEWAPPAWRRPTSPRSAAARLDRLVAAVVARDLGGLLLFDPLNIRYATNSTNMQVWNMHNPFRACLVLPDGHMVLWDYKHAPFLAAHNPLVAELRSGASFLYSLTGEATDAAAARLRRRARRRHGRPRRPQPPARRRQDHARRLPRAHRRRDRGRGRRARHRARPRGQGPRGDPRDALRAARLRDRDGRDARRRAPRA